MKTNEQQFRKPHRHDGPNQYMDKHMMDGNNHMMPQDGMGPNNGQHMHQNGQNQMMPQDGMGPNNWSAYALKWSNAYARPTTSTT